MRKTFVRLALVFVLSVDFCPVAKAEVGNPMIPSAAFQEAALLLDDAMVVNPILSAKLVVEQKVRTLGDEIDARVAESPANELPTTELELQPEDLVKGPDGRGVLKEVIKGPGGVTVGLVVELASVWVAETLLPEVMVNFDRPIHYGSQVLEKVPAIVRHAIVTYLGPSVDHVKRWRPATDAELERARDLLKLKENYDINDLKKAFRGLITEANYDKAAVKLYERGMTSDEMAQDPSYLQAAKEFREIREAYNMLAEALSKKAVRKGNGVGYHSAHPGTRAVVRALVESSVKHLHITERQLTKDAGIGWGAMETLLSDKSVSWKTCAKLTIEIGKQVVSHASYVIIAGDLAAANHAIAVEVASRFVRRYRIMLYDILRPLEKELRLRIFDVLVTWWAAHVDEKTWPPTELKRRLLEVVGMTDVLAVEVINIVCAWIVRVPITKTSIPKLELKIDVVRAA